MTQRTYHQYCPIAHALDLIGERWTLLIIRNLFTGPKRFSDLLHGLPGIGTNILTARLKALEELGLIQSRYLPPPAASSVYELTPFGQSLEDVLAALARWGAQSLGAPQADQVMSMESVTLMVRLFFKNAAQSGLSGTYAVKMEGTPFSANFGVNLHDQMVALESALPSAYDLALRTDLQTFGALATGRLSFQEAIAQGRLHLEGSESETACFLAAFETADETG